jgi:hypothetical protein
VDSFFLLTVLLGEVVLVNSIKELLHRVRPTFNPIAETLGPSFPSGHSATAAAFYAAVALVLARRRSPRARSLLAGAAVAVAIGVAASRVLLGVHWLSDVVAGLAFGWGWFAVCAVAFGGRFLNFGGPAEKATRVAERAEAARRRRARRPAARSSHVVEPAPASAQDAAPTAETREHDEPMGQGLVVLEEVELLLRDWPPPLVDELRGVAGDLVRRRLQMLGPEAEPRLAGEGGIEETVHLRVVEQRMGIQVRRPDREPRVVDDPDLRVDVDDVANFPRGVDGAREKRSASSSAWINAAI